MKKAIESKNPIFTKNVVGLTGGLDHGKRKEFAEKVGISEVQAGKILSGRVPKWDTLLKIGKAYDVSIDWLLKGQGPVFRKSVFSGPPQPKIAHKFFDILKYGGKDAELLRKNIDWIHEKAGIEKKKKQAARSKGKKWDGIERRGSTHDVIPYPKDTLIAQWDKDFICRFISPDVPKLINRPITDFVGKHSDEHLDWIHSDDRQTIKNMVEQVRKFKIPIRCRVRMLTQNGPIMTEHLLTPCMNNGDIMCYSGFAFELKRESDKLYFD